tara:strand:- start:649 stop:1584 length:936 start_codon:yes stop_codon:yes gene_type:complete
LVELARPKVEALSQRPRVERLQRWLLVRFLLSAWFGQLFRVGQIIRPALPQSLARHVLEKRPVGLRPESQGDRSVLMLEGCVQPSIAPQINAAARRVLAKLDVNVITASEAGCCGALALHLADSDRAMNSMRRNIDAWWPQIQEGVDAIVMTSSGCGVTVREYGQLLKDDSAYAEKAARVSSMTVDLCEYVSPEEARALESCSGKRVAFHSPCTLQHGQGIRGRIESILESAGAILTPVQNTHLCCGAAGTYSILQPKLSSRLLGNKLSDLGQDDPEVIATANIGCLAHLASRSDPPVRHWIELIDPAPPD